MQYDIISFLKLRVETFRDRLLNVWVWHWDWLSPLKGRTVGEFQNFTSLLESFSLNQVNKDVWMWKLTDDGIFDVKKLRLLIEKRWHEIKANTDTQASQEKLPVRMLLDHRGIDISSILCPLCEDSNRSVDHVLVRCRLAHTVWTKIFAWWSISGSNFYDVKQLIEFKGCQKWNKETKLIWEPLGLTPSAGNPQAGALPLSTPELVPKT
ncbi:hypothetical protein OSB04_020306 [Centaurea solstitialis]|uniref:Reverse transcriptase zinc-binding domain-containing protein n=1 Tax=Centaurea solstitialis TaxID=347529 RepID=A0AA38TBI9_9ASTR|nr:hypothetical protein OSB04_020306 [Centaurea solstitialis]